MGARRSIDAPDDRAVVLLVLKDIALKIAMAALLVAGLFFGVRWFWTKLGEWL